MICNKCGKNNPAGAEKCSFCKEPMPETTNCGGFSDILTYSAPSVTDTVPLAPIEPAPVRNVIEAPADEPWYADILSKKNIISLAAILLCVITLIVIIITSCSTEKDTAGNGKDATEEAVLEELSAGLQDMLFISSFDESFPAYKFEKNQSEVKIELRDCENTALNMLLIRFDKENHLITPEKTTDSKVSKEMFDEGFYICFRADADKFPLKLHFNGNKKAEPYELILNKDNKLEWVSAADEKDADEEKEKEEEIPSTNQPKPKVNKVGIIDLKDYGFPKDKTTEIELRYDGKVIEKRTVSNENNTKVEVAVEIESNVESVDLALWYDGKQRQTISVNLTESK